MGYMLLYRNCMYGTYVCVCTTNIYDQSKCKVIVQLICFSHMQMPMNKNRWISYDTLSQDRTKVHMCVCIYIYVYNTINIFTFKL